jgi:hypothetical protein
MVRWRPTADVVEESNVYRYMASHGIEDLRGFE